MVVHRESFGYHGVKEQVLIKETNPVVFNCIIFFRKKWCLIWHTYLI